MDWSGRVYDQSSPAHSPRNRPVYPSHPNDSMRRHTAMPNCSNVADGRQRVNQSFGYTPIDNSASFSGTDVTTLSHLGRQKQLNASAGYLPGFLLGEPIQSNVPQQTNARSVPPFGANLSRTADLGQDFSTRQNTSLILPDSPLNKSSTVDMGSRNRMGRSGPPLVGLMSPAPSGSTPSRSVINEVRSDLTTSILADANETSQVNIHTEWTTVLGPTRLDRELVDEIVSTLQQKFGTVLDFIRSDDESTCNWFFIKWPSKRTVRQILGSSEAHFLPLRQSILITITVCRQDPSMLGRSAFTTESIMSIVGKSSSSPTAHSTVRLARVTPTKRNDLSAMRSLTSGSTSTPDFTRDRNGSISTPKTDVKSDEKGVLVRALDYIFG